jgi:hypothetical protein
LPGSNVISRSATFHLLYLVIRSASEQPSTGESDLSQLTSAGFAAVAKRF